MARIPSFEEILLEVHQSLGLKRDPRKKRFAGLEMQLDNHGEMAGEMLMAIFKALDMDKRACRDAVCDIMEWSSFHKALELRTWTGNASQKQVLWHLLAYSYVPALARRLAFWSLHNTEKNQPPVDAGMPGGKFWFLPNWDRGNDRVELPVPQVVNWLLDLLEGSSLEDAIGGLYTPNGDAMRTLQGWKLEGWTPKSAEKIKQIFPDDAELNFPGAFSPDEGLSTEAQFHEALSFVSRKGLNSEALQDEIPMLAERLEPILKGSASDEEKQEFVRLIALRYAKPEMRTIRQRLRVARMAQDAYQRLLKFLCPGVEATCTDPARNKLLQLIGLFGTIYNQTIAAWKNGDTNEEQDAWFEAQLPPWDRADLLLSILPSRRETAYMELAERLTREFMRLEPDSPLEDLVPLSEGDAGPIIERRFLLIQQELEEDQRLEKLVERVRSASPWRALQAEDSYWVVSQFTQRDGLSSEIREMALRRMGELAATQGQKVGVCVVELGFLLNGEPKQRPKDIRQRVQFLLDEAQVSCQGYEEWEAPLLRFRAKHRLFQNDFDGARADFKAALDACSERGFGDLRGEIAEEGFAAEIAEEGFIPQNQEKYYRNMRGYMEFPNGAPSFEVAAVECEVFFWSTLYQPYQGVERQDGAAIIVFKETLGLIKDADWDGLRTWMQRHAKAFRKSNLKDARRNSVLLQWLKLRPVLSAYGAKMPLKVAQHMNNWRVAIHLLLKAWPEQANIADFKGQTPLMLAANHGDAELTRLLAPMSDVDAQDHLGRTALHAAVTGRSPECVTIVLDHNPDVAKVTFDEENTALHTAVRSGVPENVRLILEEFPGLVPKTNAAGKTPLAMAHEILENLPESQAYMRKENRRTGLKEDFEAIIALLELESPRIH